MTESVTGQLTATSEPVSSSVTGMSAAVLRCAAGWDERTTDAEGRPATRRRRLGTVVQSGQLTLTLDDGRTVRIPAGSFAVDVPQDELHAMPLSGRLPPELEEKAGSRIEHWLIHEAFIQVGDPVELTGTLKPSTDPSHDLELVADGLAHLRDRSLDDVAEDLAAMGIDPKAKGRIAAVALGVVLVVVVLVLVSMVLVMVGD